jgi:dienelactone hydrolase
LFLFSLPVALGQDSSYYSNPDGSHVSIPLENFEVTFTDRYGIPHRALIYLPPGFDSSGRYPAVICCGGWMGFLEMYTIMPRMLAYHGYVAMLFEPTLETTPISSMVLSTVTPKWVQDVQDAITYLTEQSPVKDSVDSGRIGIEGHSMGGFTVSEAPVVDDRVKAVIALSDATPLAGLFKQVPLMIITGDFDIVVNDQLVAIPAYYAAQPPKELIVIKGGTHDGFSNLLEPYYPKPPWQHYTWEHYASAWFDYWLKGDGDAVQKLTHTLYTPDGTECLSAAHRSVYNFGEGDVVIAGPRLESPPASSTSGTGSSSTSSPESTSGGQGQQGGGLGSLLAGALSKIVAQLLPRLAEAFARLFSSFRLPL